MTQDTNNTSPESDIIAMEDEKEKSSRATRSKNNKDDDDDDDDGDDEHLAPGAISIGGDGNDRPALGVEHAIDAEKGDIVNASRVDEDELEEKIRRNLKEELGKATEVKNDNSDKQMDMTKKVFILLFLLGGIAFASIAGVLLPDAKDKDPVPVEEVSEFDQLRSILVPISGEAAFENEASAQSQAFNFLLNEDELNLDIYDPANELDLIERYVMMVLYYSTDGPNWADQHLFGSNYTTCEWPNIGEIEEGSTTANEVDCDEITGRIVKVNLDRNNLNGTIPSEIAALSSLEIFTVGGNRGVVGTIPTEIVQLSSTLNFWQTSGCQLTGTIPSDITKLTKMEIFNMYRNQISGTLPEFVNFPNLRSIDVGENLFTGTIPDVAEGTSFLQIYMEGNSLVGTIPQSYYKLPTVERFSFSRNQLTGTIPPEIQQLELVSEIYLDGNLFTGTIPTEIGTLRRGSRMDFQGNAFTGTIPTEIGDMRELTRMDLSGTQLEGTIPREMGNLDLLQRLRLSSTKLTGTIPVEFMDLKNLQNLEIQNSTLSGGIEEAFCSQESLITSIKADCSELDPNPISCSCCTDCCNDGEDCEVRVQGICENQSGKFETADLDRNTTCTCLEGGLRLECTDATCPTCSFDGELCALNTEYGYTFNETNGEILSFHNNIVYTKGEGYVGNVITFNEDDEGCTFFLNGEKCRDCTGITCRSGFQGYSAFCDNVEGGTAMSMCEEFVDAGLMEILYAFDPSQLQGCELLLEKV